MSVNITAQMPFFLPDFYYFYRIFKSDIFIAADFLKFRKQSPLVRTRLKINDFKSYLTVPVIHPGNDPQPRLTDVRLNDGENWRRKHLQTLKSLYSGYPFFADYFPHIEQIYGTGEVRLAPFCMDLLLFLITCLVPDKKIVLASGNGITDLESLQEWLHGAGEYQLLIDSEELPFYQKHFSEKFYTVLEYPAIRELPENYHPEMSILVLLFLRGPETAGYFS